MHLQFFADDEEKKEDPAPSGEESTPPAGDPPAGDPPSSEQETPVTGDLATILLDIQGVLANIQKTLERTNPPTETQPEPEGETPPADDNPEETPPAPPEGEGDEEEPSEEEVKAIDEILQRN